MIIPFLKMAAVSPGRQRSFRWLVVGHLLVLGTGTLAVPWLNQVPPGVFLGNLLLVMGMVEGALLMGWRLTQLPRSRSLEFLLVSPLRPPALLLAEALAGVARLALTTLAGLPILVLLAQNGVILFIDLHALLVMPLVWGMAVGLGLASWAYEPRGVRLWGERIILALVLLYLVVGIIAGENLRQWLGWLPPAWGRSSLAIFSAFHTYNPFAVMKFALEESPLQVWERVVGQELLGLGVALLFLARSAWRLHPHFQERHYRPVTARGKRGPEEVGDQPLSWWAVRRVLEYSGRINLWLAGGFGVLYALYTLAGDRWPAWSGKGVFLVFDRLGGMPVLAVGLMLLATVPAAFQYGLWDSNAQDRCRRLELLLLTGLEARDYWAAAAAAAWRRGRGYLAVAAFLLAAACLAGTCNFDQVLLSLAGGVIVWCLYFTLGFGGFCGRLPGNGLALFLTLGLPLLTVFLFQVGWSSLAGFLPPGIIYPGGSADSFPRGRWLGTLVWGLAALALVRWSLANAEGELRRWLGNHLGRSSGP